MNDLGKKERGRAKTVWNTLNSGRSALLERCVQYAGWTLPYIMPEETDTVENTELPTAYGSIGARCVNHLSNVITEVLFPVGHPFFRLRSGDTLIAAAKNAGVSMSTVDEALSASEKAALNRVSISELRSEHVEAVKALIVTGNSLLYYPDPVKQGDTRHCIVYNLRDYCILRNRSGDITKLVTRDKTRFDSLSWGVQSQVKSEDFKDDDVVELYTLVELDPQTDKYFVTQAVNEIDIKPDGLQLTYPRDLLPWIPITWTRNSNESYGRGLVEQYAYGFNAYNSLCKSLVLFAAIAADVKRCADPNSIVDIDILNKSEAGQWVAAKKDDLWALGIQSGALDMQAVQSVIQRLEQELSQAFMLTAGSVRNAERVTAEEVKLLASELEKSNGGIYSKLASEWQTKLANLLLFDTGIKETSGIKVQIVTGADSLSRSAEMELMYTVMQDVATVTQVEAQAQGQGLAGYLNNSGLAAFIQANRGIDQGTFFLTEEQKQQNDAAAAQAKQQEAMQQQAAPFAEAAAKGDNE